MDLTGLYSLVAILISTSGLFVGSWAKRKSQMIIPFNDPLSWSILILVFLILMMPDINPDWVYIDPYNLHHDSCLIGFVVMYIYGYMKEELLHEYVSSHDIWKLKQEIRPIAYYWNDQNQLCWQPQSMRYVLKRMLFNIDNPLDFSIDRVSRRRYIEFQGKYLKMSAYCVDTAKMEIKPEYIKKGPFRFKVLRCHCDPSPLNTYDEYDFYCEGKIASEYVQNYQKLKIDNMNANADMRLAMIIGAVDIVNSITSKTPDSVIINQITDDLNSRNRTTHSDVERAGRVGVTEDSKQRRRRQETEQTTGGDSDE